MNALSARGVTVRRGGRLVLEDVSFSAQAGAITCVLGHAGAGKTSLLAALAGLLKMERGAVFLGAAEVTQLPRRRLGVALLPPGTALPEAREVQAALKSLAGRSGAASLGERMAALGLSPLAGRTVALLSHGEAALALTAARLALPGDALLVDEAGAGLDDQATDALLDVLRREARTGRVVLIATRSPRVALCADHLVLLADGHLLQAGVPACLYAEPCSAVAARLTGPANILEGTVRELRAGSFVWASGGRHVQAVTADQPRPSLGSPVALCLRPERVAVLSEGQAADNVAEGTILDVRSAGALIELAVQTHLGVMRVAALYSVGAVGGSVRLGWAADAASIIEESKQSFFEKKDQRTFVC